jgi:K+-sensing histidine kinase KdpD
MVQRLAKAGVRSAVSKSGGASQLDGEPPSNRIWQRNVVPLFMPLLGVGLVTAILLLLDQPLAATLVPIAYLIPVIVAATQWGIWPATLASIVGMAAADFFFIPPVYSFMVADPREVIDLLLFLVVALVSSNLASRLRRETEALRQREKEIQQLYEFSRRLAACFTVSDLISAIHNYLSRTLGQQTVFFAATADGHFGPPESGSLPNAVQEGVAATTAAIGVPGQTIIDEPTENVWLLRAVGSETAVHGLVAVNIGSGSPRDIDSRTRRFQTMLEEVSLTLQRLDIEQAIEDARLHLQAQLLRDAFHGTLSHELCTPLAAIRGSASVLDSMPLIREDGRIHSLVEAISDEVAHLDGFIRNLLNATRVTEGGVSARLE